MDFLQLFLFCLLGKVHTCARAFFLAMAFRSARILCFGIAYDQRLYPLDCY